MSASISTSPGSVIAPAFCNRLFYTFTGHVPATEYKFRYVIDVEVDGTNIARILKEPDPGSNDCTFNLSAVLRGQLAPDPEGETGLHLATHPIGGTGKPFELPAAGTECVQVTVRIGRQWAASATGSTNILADEDNESLYLFNAAFQFANTASIADSFYCGAVLDRLLSNRARDTFFWSKNPGLASTSVIIPTYEDAYYALSFLHDDGTYATGHAAARVGYEH